MKTAGVSYSRAPQPDVQAGHLLIADPSLRDSIFNRTIILLADNTSNGAFGLILNQPSEHCVGDFLKEEAHASLARIPVFIGGPVANEHLTFAAFWMSPEGELRYAVRISADEAIQYSKNPGTLVRAFAGYSGWDVGQLQNEVEAHSWVLTTPPENFLGMTHDQNLWEQTLNSMTPFHQLLALCPENPWLN